MQKQPTFAAAYHESAAIEMLSRHRDKAIATLKASLKAVPDDATGLATLIELLTEPREDGSKPTPAELAEAQALADSVGQHDEKGNLALALAVGFHKAGQLDLAMPWAEKAAAKLDAPPVHLNYGDLLLSVAEEAHDPAQARTYFQRAVAQYDLVLKSQATSIAAVNNKAWILHAHLVDSRLLLCARFTQTVGSRHAPRRVLRHSGLGPGGHRPRPRCRRFVCARPPQGSRSPGAQLEHGQAVSAEAQPQGDLLPRKSLRQPQPPLPQDGRRGRLADEEGNAAVRSSGGHGAAEKSRGFTPPARLRWTASTGAEGLC